MLQDVSVRCRHCGWRGTVGDQAEHANVCATKKKPVTEQVSSSSSGTFLRSRFLPVVLVCLLVANTFVFVMRSPATDRADGSVLLNELRRGDDLLHPLSILATSGLFGSACRTDLPSHVRVVHGLAPEQAHSADLDAFVVAAAAALNSADGDPKGTLFLIDPENVVMGQQERHPGSRPTTLRRPQQTNVSDSSVFSADDEDGGLEDENDAEEVEVLEDVSLLYRTVVTYLQNAKCRVVAGLKLHHYDQVQTCAIARRNVAEGRRYPFQVLPPYGSLPMLVTRDVLQLFVLLGSYPNTTVRRQCSYDATLDACLGMFLSGRDYYLFSWNEIDELSSDSETSPRTFAVTEDFPYDPFARSPSEFTARPPGNTNSSERRTISPRRLLRPPPGVEHRWDDRLRPSRFKNGRTNVLAVLYVPVRTLNDVAREVIRCYWASLSPRIKREFPLHFVLGAKRRDDQYFPLLFSSKGRSKLFKENATSGDLLLFDSLDADIPHSTSGTMIKILLAAAHAAATYHYYYFVRGADDAYHNVFRMYYDFRNMSAEGKAFRVYEGHKMFRWINSFAGLLNLLNERVALPRNLAPVAIPHYLTGGGYMMSSDVATFLAQSSLLVPPLPWHAEDYNIGRVTVPFAEAAENFRFHDFFNATPFVRKAFARTVPLILDYCTPWDYIIHKNPWGTYRYIGKDHVMCCTHVDFASTKAEPHECNSRVFETNWTLPPRSSSLDVYYQPYRLPIARKGQAGRDRAATAGRAKYQVGGTGLESCTWSHFMSFLVSAVQNEKYASGLKRKILRNATLFNQAADGGGGGNSGSASAALGGDGAAEDAPEA